MTDINTYNGFITHTYNSYANTIHKGIDVYSIPYANRVKDVNDHIGFDSTVDRVFSIKVSPGYPFDDNELGNRVKDINDHCGFIDDNNILTFKIQCGIDFTDDIKLAVRVTEFNTHTGIDEFEDIYCTRILNGIIDTGEPIQGNLTLSDFRDHDIFIMYDMPSMYHKSSFTNEYSDVIGTLKPFSKNIIFDDNIIGNLKRLGTESENYEIAEFYKSALPMIYVYKGHIDEIPTEPSDITFRLIYPTDYWAESAQENTKVGFIDGVNITMGHNFYDDNRELPLTYDYNT